MRFCGLAAHIMRDCLKSALSALKRLAGKLPVHQVDRRKISCQLQDINQALRHVNVNVNANVECRI